MHVSLASMIVLQDRSGERGAKIRFNVEVKKIFAEKIFASCVRGEFAEQFNSSRRNPP